MTRAIPVVRRLRTLDLNRLRPIAEYAESLVANTIESNQLDIHAKLELATEYFNKVTQLDHEILEHPDLPDGEMDMECANYDEHRALGLLCIASLRARLQVDPSRAVASETVIQQTAQGSTASQQTGARIDPFPVCAGSRSSVADVTPEPFDGNRLHYRAFTAQFNNWISRKGNLTKLDKLVVLRKLLKGEAKSLIESLEIIESNYDVAVSLLEQAFGQVDIERQQIMSTLFHMPRMKSPSDVAGLRSALNVVQSCIQRMEALGASLSEIAFAIEPAILASVPSEIIFEYSESVGRSSGLAASSRSSDTATDATLSSRTADEISGLIAYLRRFANHRERTDLILKTHRTVDDRDAKRTSTSAGRNQRRTPPPASKHSTINALAQTKTRTRSCFFCKDTGHKPSKCTAEVDLKKRHEILERLKRCAKCFRFKHDENSTCQGPKEACSTCQSREHYTAMHSQSVGGTVTAVTSEDDALVLLHTASVFVVSGPHRIPARLFLDGGSSATFVHPSLVRKLTDASPIETARMGFTTFSDKQQLVMKRFRITLESTHDSQRVDIRAFEYNFKANPSPQCSTRDRRMIENFASDHVLADKALSASTPAPPVTILIGRDQFFKIAHVGREKRLEGELVARDSVFGWIVGGATEPVDNRHPELLRADVHCCVASISRSARDLEKLWRLEAIGIEPEDHSSLSSDEASALRQFRETLRYKDKRYVVEVPKSPSIQALQSNLKPALTRLERQLSPLRKNPEKYERNHREIMEFVVKGHAVTDSRLGIRETGCFSL